MALLLHKVSGERKYKLSYGMIAYVYRVGKSWRGYIVGHCDTELEESTLTNLLLELEAEQWTLLNSP